MMMSIISELYCIQLNNRIFYALISNKQANIDVLCAIKLFDYDAKGNIYNIVSEPGGSQLSKLLIIWYRQMIYAVKYDGLAGYSIKNNNITVFVKAWNEFTKMNEILTPTSPLGWIMYPNRVKNVEYFNERNMISIYVAKILDIYVPKVISGKIIDFMFGINLNICLYDDYDCKFHDSPFSVLGYQWYNMPGEFARQVYGLYTRYNVARRTSKWWDEVDYIYE